MKKLLAVLMTLSLLLVSFAAFADEIPTDTVKFEDHKEVADKYPGEFKTVGQTGLMMYVPNSLKEVAPTEEQTAGGIALILNTEDGKAVINESSYPVDIDTFIAGAKNSKDGNVEHIVKLTLNDVEAMELDVTKDGVTTICMCLSAEGGHTMVFSFTPINEGSEYGDMLKMMAASIQINK